MHEAKQKKIYVCQNCAFESVKWLGKCPECEAWSSFEEEIRQASKRKYSGRSIKSEFKPLLDGGEEIAVRFSTGIEEFDRTLGGGIIGGMVVLIGGDPGIGKSTLMLQVLNTLQSQQNLLYISGEESLRQVQSRAHRLGLSNNQILFSTETNLQALLEAFETQKPALVIVDSIQTLYNDELDAIPGNLSQLRSCAAGLHRFAKQFDIPIFLVGHVTKDGSIAGPKVLEHMVDTVIYFEGERQYDYRLLRSVKNRFGPVNEIGLFRMTDKGLQSIKNPSEIFIDDMDPNRSGNAVVVVMEGNRPFMVQVQALVTKTQFGTPQRTASGIDHRRMNLLLAVLEKRNNKPFGFYDVFLKVAGGLRIDEPAADLGICMALASSFDDKAVAARTAYIGEVGLGGEVRIVSRLTERIREAVKLGYQNIVIPKSKNITSGKYKATLKQVSSLHELI